MAIFDALQRVSVGSYIPVDSVIHRRDPRAKILSVFILILAVTLSASLHGLLAAVLSSFVLLLSSRVSFKAALQKLRVPLPMILLLALLQVFITPHNAGEIVYYSYGWFTITDLGLRAGAMLLLRFTGLVWLFSAAGAAISSVEMIYGLDLIVRPLRKLGLRTDALTMTMQMMLRFIPYLIFNAEKIARAQAARGARWDDPRGGIFQRARQVFPLILPLFSTSLKQADALARAMIARAYGSSSRRTGLREYHLNTGDALFLFLSLAAGLLVFLLP